MRSGDAPTAQELEEVVVKVDDTVKTFKKNAKDVNEKELDAAREVLEKLLGRLTGPDGERAIQSYGLFAKKLAADDPRPRTLIAARLNANAPVRIGELKTALGSCWQDGAITVNDTLDDVSSVSLPLTPEGEAARSFGNAPLLLVTRVPIEAPK